MNHSGFCLNCPPPSASLQGNLAVYMLYVYVNSDDIWDVFGDDIWDDWLPKITTLSIKTILLNNRRTQSI